jgi:methylthioribose-1-phosphate isomerase
VIRAAFEQGKRIHVLLDETRPRLQGSRLSAWELEQLGISYDILPDTAAGYYMRKGEINIVLVGADRIAANGDAANKIGTYQIAVLQRKTTFRSIRLLRPRQSTFRWQAARRFPSKSGARTKCSRPMATRLRRLTSGRAIRPST